MAGEALRLQRLFDEADLPVLFVKGASLAMLAFGNLGLRVGQDIDLLVTVRVLPAATTFICARRLPPRSILRLTSATRSCGCCMPLRKDLGFVHQVTGLRIELHWRLFLNPHAMAADSIMAASRVVPLTGAKGLRTMGEEDLFAYLCMHGALHWWNRLKWLADINALLTAAPEENRAPCPRRRSQGRRARRRPGVLLCRRLLGTPLPTAPRYRAKSLTERWLEATALNAMTTGQGEHDPHDTRSGPPAAASRPFFSAGAGAIGSQN